MPINRTTEKTLKKLEAISGIPFTLGNFIWAIREGEEMSQSEFALQLGISRQYLCDVEKGRRFISPAVAVKFAKILGYSERQFAQLCLQDMLKRDGLKMQVSLFDAA